ncbi:MAG TPA: EAL domain-containing protein [Solirubrobacterales bacterium]|jgi:diguanylate cyclase (GGDEF)-like protein|nr:EAL domain-containing protein [Solirubrobacterales bacterium]
MKNPQRAGKTDPAVDAVLAKLAPEDRATVQGALEQAEKTEAELRFLADHDPLTGLLNRRSFRAELDQYVSFSARYGGRGAVMVIDIDGLKEVNDKRGHQAGDRLIRRVADILRERVRATDLVARLSGDEFAVLMPQTDTAGALQLGEDLRAQVAEGFSQSSEIAPASISVGITMFGGQNSGSEAVLLAADQAMYQAKKEGRNRIMLFHAPGEAANPTQRAQTTSARIRDALTQDRLRLATQPIRSLADGGIERYELLLRMTGESGELLPAASFIEVAERSGMVQELDRWVVARALELMAERQRAGKPVSLHMNLSGASMTDLSVLEFIERRLDEGEADPARCTFEITQTAQVEDYDTAAGFADRLTEFGCEVAIDDYGAGFGPFSYLKRVPFDVIKIDGAFVREMSHNDADQLVVKAIVEIARGLGKQTIAEFVENEDTRTMLRDYGVDMAQGYHLGRPADAAETLAAA